jgi:hypothetical protein
MIAGLAGAGHGCRRWVGDGGLLQLSIELTVEHELVGSGLEPVDGDCASSGSAMKARHAIRSEVRVGESG